MNLVHIWSLDMDSDSGSRWLPWVFALWMLLLIFLHFRHETLIIFDNFIAQFCDSMWLAAVAVSRTGAYSELVKKRPSGSLVSAANITSLLIHVAFVIFIQAIVFVFLQSQPWSVTLTLTFSSQFHFANVVVSVVIGQLNSSSTLWSDCRFC